MRSRTLTLLAPLAAVATTTALLAGCAAIPESTPVVVVDENLGGPEEPTVGAPPAGLEDPLAVVRLFVEAGISHADEHQAARSYLTAESAQRWVDAGPITVLEDDFDTAPFNPGAADADRRRQVTLRARQIGQLDQTGVFSLDRKPLDRRLTLLKENGEWRIADPPPGLMLRLRDFRATFRVVDLSFVDSTSDILIKDRRWVLNRPPSALPGRVVSLLLGDPSPDLRGSVINELSGARLRTNVAHAPDSVLTVDLTGVQQLNSAQRKLAAAQIVHTIAEVVNQPVRILVDNEQLDQDRTLWRLDDVEDFAPLVDLAPGQPGLVVTGGQILQIGSNRPVDVAVPNVVSAAQSPDGEKFAVVATEPNGAQRLWVGPTGALKPVELTATSLGKPNWRRDRDEVWLVADASQVVAVSTEGVPRVQRVAANELTALGGISELRLSRDGVRAAAIVNNTLVLASVVGSGAQLSLRNARVLPPANPIPLVDVDFLGTDLVVVATASEDTPVYETSFDGLSTYRSFGTSNLTLPISNIAAVSERPVLVADQFGVWSAKTASSVWEQVDEFGPNSVPVYPG